MTRQFDAQVSPVRYGGWSKDRQGWFLGLGGGSWIAILLGGLPLLIAAGAHQWLAALGWLPAWAVLIVLVAVPVRGRSALRWAIDSLLRCIGVVMRWTDWQSKAAAGAVDRFDEADLPGVLSGIRTHDGPPFGPLLARPAIVADNRERTWAVVARITHPGIGLSEGLARTRMGNGLSELLDGAASAELVSVMALQIRTVSDDGAERSAWLQANLRKDAPSLALAVNAELAQVMTQAGVRHEAFVTVVVPEGRIAKQAKEAGGGVDGRARVLYGVMGGIEARLMGPVGCTSVAWLDSPALAAAIRTGFAPGDRVGLIAADIAAQSDPHIAATLPMAAAGPTSTPNPERRYYAHDAWHSVTCTILLPDKGAVMGALAPVFTPTTAGERRSVTVFFEPISHDKADRMVGAESMSSDLATEIRRKSGFKVRASHRRDVARVEGQDVRLADGNAFVRVGIAAAVTVPNTLSITDFGRRLESDITGSGFKPLRLDLAQDSGFAAACIPLGIGLPKRRGAK
ncbi:MAG TPA: SCO6880 family protein [Jatrophihabitans sp.]|uniref:SCO6880 family protein n=1 Tax=Jatrophihabitans sp. TaxID=1932789 RepID=UPI002EDD9F40